MKKFGTAILLWHLAFLGAAQQQEMDSLRKVLQTTKNDTARILALVRLAYYTTSTESFHLDKEALELSRRIGYKRGESAALAQYCNDFLSSGNYVKAMDYALQGLKLNEESNNTKGIASNYFFIARVYVAQADYKKALTYLYRSLDMHPNKTDPNLRIMYMFMGDAYEKLNRLDSALFYYQRSYEQFNAFPNKEQFSALLSRLGDVHSRLGNKELALAFYRMGLERILPGIGDVEFGSNYYGIAQLFATRNRDSAIYYANRALTLASSNPDMTIKAGLLLSRLYEAVDPQKALHFYKLANVTRDSIYETGKLLQIQNLSFNEAERQKERTLAEEKATEERKTYLQLASIALAIVLLVTSFLLFSHTILANEKLIRFLGILSLLIVFEFINLLIHPFIAHITHHSPSLMLCIMVAVAALLIPVHHQLEHWVKGRLVEKNNRLRLAAARKTVEQLENKLQKKEPKTAKEK